MKTLWWKKDHVTQSSSYPKSRVGHTLTYISDSDLYLLYGGISNKRINDVYLYSPNTHSWTFQETTGKVPEGTCYHWAWYEAPNFFIMGGETDKKKINEIYCLSLETWTWRKLFVFEPPLPRYQHSMAKVEKPKSIYLFGGYTTKNMSDLWELDLSLVSYKGKGDIPGAVWSNLSQKGMVPPARRGHKIVKFPGENKLALYGGYTLQNDEVDKKQDNDVYVLDVKHITWTRLKCEGTLPEPRALHWMSFFTLNKMVIFGGLAITAEVKDKDTPTVLDNTYLVNFKEEKVSQPFIANERPQARYGHVCASNENCKEPELVIIGGMAATYWTMDPYRLYYQLTDKDTKWQKHDEGLLKNQELMSTIKISNKNILENNKIIAELENEAIELSSKNAKKNRQVNKLQAELDELSSKKLSIERCLEEK